MAETVHNRMNHLNAWEEAKAIPKMHQQTALSMGRNADSPKSSFLQIQTNTAGIEMQKKLMAESESALKNHKTPATER